MNFKLENLVKQYDNTIILNDLCFSIKDKKSIALIGKSGAGKSTLLRLLAGLDNEYTGDITVNGQVLSISNLPDYHNQISYVFQKHNLFPHLNAIDNITLILEKIKKMSKEDAYYKALDCFKKVFMDEHINKFPNEVSGGQSQRIAMARALATDPSIIFLDEPTSALDPILCKEVLNTLKNLRNIGTDFVFVTHEISFVKDFADYVIFMEDGNIIEYGSDILINPKSNSLKEFIKDII